MKKTIKLFRILMTFISLIWILNFFIINWENFIISMNNYSINDIVYAISFIFVGLVPGAWAWYKLISCEITNLPLFRGLLIYIKSGVGKYTPGGILSFSIQHHLLENEHVTLILLLRVFFGLAISSCFAATLVGLYSIVFIFNYPVELIYIGSILLIGILYLLSKANSWPFFHAQLEKIGIPSPSLFVEVTFIMCLAWGITGLHLIALNNEIYINGVLLISAYALSSIVGIIFAALPGALGVKDGTLLILLNNFMDPSNAMALVILSRMLIVIGDVFSALISTIIMKTNRMY